jgi:hypothetical protein
MKAERRFGKNCRAASYTFLSAVTLSGKTDDVGKNFER